jgi:hypothetical protein
MPTVPRIQREVGPQPLPNARRAAKLTPTAAGVGLAAAQGNIGEALQQTGYTVGIMAARLQRAQAEEAERARDEANRAAVMRLKNKADVWKRNNVYDPTTGYLTVVGENALLLPEKAQQDLKKFGEDIDPDLNTPEQELAWEEIYAELQDSTMLTVYRHTSTEGQKVMVAESTARMTNSQSLAIASALDPPQAVKHITEGMKAIEETARLEGWGKDTTDLAKQGFASNVNVGIIHTLVKAGQSDKARIVFNEARKHNVIDGKQIPDLIALLDEQDMTAEAQQAFDELDKSGLPLDQQMTAAKQRYTGKKRELVLDLIRQEQSDDHMAEAATIKARDHDIMQILLKDPRFNAIPAHWRKDFGSAEGTHWNSVIANIRASRESGGTPSPYAKISKPSVKDYLLTWMQKDPAFYANIPLGAPRYVGSLTQEDWEQFRRAQVAVLNDQQKNAVDILKGNFTFKDVWSAALTSASIRKDDPRLDDIQATVEHEIKVEATYKGSPLTSAEMEPVVRRVLQRHTLEQGTLWDKTRLGFEIKFADIPLADRKDIIAAIQKIPGQPAVRNPATDDRVLVMYRRMLQLRAEGKAP